MSNQDKSLGQESETRSITKIGDNSNIKDEEKVISRQSKKLKALKMVAYLIASFYKGGLLFSCWGIALEYVITSIIQVPSRE